MQKKTHERVATAWRYKNHGQGDDGVIAGHAGAYTGHGIDETGAGHTRLMLHSLDKWRIDCRRLSRAEDTKARSLVWTVWRG